MLVYLAAAVSVFREEGNSRIKSEKSSVFQATHADLGGKMKSWLTNKPAFEFMCTS